MIRLSAAEQSQIERQALANGGMVVPRPVVYPGDEPVEIETRMAWSEKKFQAEVVKLAKANDWMVYHTWLSIRSEAGFPDLVMLHRRHGMLVFAELKRQKGKESQAQKEWRKMLTKSSKYCRLWRPSDWEEIVATLVGPIGS